MKKSILAKQKKIGRGRPRTGSDPMIGLRASSELRASIEEWAHRQDDAPKLSEAIRRLVELGLTVRTASARPLAAGADRAKELAGKVIDSLTPAATDAEEKSSRKRRLLKGPQEFREVRVDRPKAKK